MEASPHLDRGPIRRLERPARQPPPRRVHALEERRLRLLVHPAPDPSAGSPRGPGPSGMDSGDAPRRNSFTIMTCSVLRTQVRGPPSRGEEQRRGRLWPTPHGSAHRDTLRDSSRTRSRRVSRRCRRVCRSNPTGSRCGSRARRRPSLRLFAMAQALTRRRRPQQEPVSASPRRLLTSSEPAAPCYARGR